MRPDGRSGLCRSQAPQRGEVFGSHLPAGTVVGTTGLVVSGMLLEVGALAAL
jgi:enamine deaminase RidA (YjgF/YER057c/UK114 family)